MIIHLTLQPNIVSRVLYNDYSISTKDIPSKGAHCCGDQARTIISMKRAPARKQINNAQERHGRNQTNILETTGELSSKPHYNAALSESRESHSNTLTILTAACHPRSAAADDNRPPYEAEGKEKYKQRPAINFRYIVTDPTRGTRPS
jgi:hypothetical protein